MLRFLTCLPAPPTIVRENSIPEIEPKIFIIGVVKNVANLSFKYVPAVTWRILDLATRGNITRQQRINPGFVTILEFRVGVCPGKQINPFLIAELPERLQLRGSVGIIRMR